MGLGSYHVTCPTLLTNRCQLPVAVLSHSHRLLTFALHMILIPDSLLSFDHLFCFLFPVQPLPAFIPPIPLTYFHAFMKLVRGHVLFIFTINVITCNNTITTTRHTNAG